MTSEEPTRVVKEPTVLTAVVPLVVLILLIFGSLLIFGLDALDGPIQVIYGLTGFKIRRIEPVPEEVA